MNKALIIGRLTANPEIRFNQSNIPYTRFSVAVNRTFTNNQGQREADFINIVAWRKQAENVCNFLKKGSLVSIEGKIQTGSYENKDGKKVYTFDVVADYVQFLDSKKDGQAQQVVPHSEPEQPIHDPFADFGDTVSIDDNFLD